MRELQAAVRGTSAGSVPGALVSVTPRGTLIQPDPTVQNLTKTSPREETTIPRWG